MAKTYTMGDIAKKFGYHSSYIRQTIKKLELVPVSEFLQGTRIYTLWDDSTVADLRNWFNSRQSEPVEAPASTGQQQLDVPAPTLDDLRQQLTALHAELENIRNDLAALHTLVLDAVTSPRPAGPTFVPSPNMYQQPWLVPNVTCNGG